MTAFQLDASILLRGIFPKAQVRVREDLVGNPLEFSMGGTSDIIEEGDYKAVAWTISEYLRRA